MELGSLLNNQDPPSIALRLKRRKPDSLPDFFEPQRDWNTWVAASSTRNYLIKDPLLDWLSYHSSSLMFKKPQYSTSVVKAVSTKKRDSFTEFIMSQGNEFEGKVMDYFYAKFGSDIFYDVGGNLNARSEEKMQDTINAMNKGIPVIYQGVLHNSDDQTYGAPDLIIRSDWLNKLITTNPIDSISEKISAPFLKNCVDDLIGKEDRSAPPYHYRIVDIKFTTLQLRADGIHLLNAGSIPAYKGQLCIYNNALGKIQGYTPPHAYLLGRKWKFTKKKVVYKGKSCDEKLGIIDYANIDKVYIEKTKAAINWIKEMRRDGADWTLGPDLPLCRTELYPNMSNQYDYPWRAIKRKFADEIKEITSLWMCGVKNRDIAIKNNIFQWTDPRCTAEMLGVNGPKTSRVLTKILEINQGEGENVQPKIILNNTDNWQFRQSLEFFVDFEFINEVVSDFTSIPHAECRSIIFMIGVGYYDLNTGAWIYREFTVDALTEAEEYKICSNFSQYVREEAEWWECNNPLMIHWSNAENWQWEHATERHKDKNRRLWLPCKKGILYDPETEPRWLDLLDIFRKEPIVIRGCLGFGLKDVAKALSNLGLINTIWDDENSCVDGSGAMLSAYKAYKDANNRNIPAKTIPLIKDIIKYNEVDCKVVGEILTYLRENHLVRPLEDDIILFDSEDGILNYDSVSEEF
ncbi:MAG TPA: hypothetical protein PKD85_02330 [Saprospiraceae bacterium]|nr:hypothetical protein [Saprospiraceae bacterium]